MPQWSANGELIAKSLSSAPCLQHLDKHWSKKLLEWPSFGMAGQNNWDWPVEVGLACWPAHGKVGRPTSQSGQSSSKASSRISGWSVTTPELTSWVWDGQRKLVRADTLRTLTRRISTTTVQPRQQTISTLPTRSLHRTQSMIRTFKQSTKSKQNHFCWFLDFFYSNVNLYRFCSSFLPPFFL